MKDNNMPYDIIHHHLQQQQQHQQQQQQPTQQHHHHQHHQPQQQQHQQQNHHQQHNPHSWNRHQQHHQHSGSIYTGQQFNQQSGSQSRSAIGSHHHHHHQQQNALGQYQHQQQLHNNASATSAYYPQTHLYPGFHGQQEQPTQQPVSEHHHHHHNTGPPVTAAGTPASVLGAAAAQQHTGVHNHQTNNTQASALGHSGWSPAVGVLASQGPHAVVTDHSTLAYMNHGYQGTNSTVNDHRSASGPLAHQPIGTGHQPSSYTVDSNYISPAVAAAAAAYDYNNYNAAFFQASSNGAQSSGLSGFWNPGQNAEQRTSQGAPNQSSLQQRQQQLATDQVSSYMQDPRLYYGRPPYGQVLQNFGQPHTHNANQQQQQQQQPHHQHHQQQNQSQQQSEVDDRQVFVPEHNLHSSSHQSQHGMQSVPASTASTAQPKQQDNLKEQADARTDHAVTTSKSPPGKKTHSPKVSPQIPMKNSKPMNESHSVDLPVNQGPEQRPSANSDTRNRRITRVQEPDRSSSIEDSLATLSISSRKTTWASIASQPTKVAQPKSLKSKIAGSNSVLSSAKHLTPLSLDSSNLDSKNGINPTIKKGVAIATTSFPRASVPPPQPPPPITKVASDLLSEESVESSKISWPAVNASMTNSKPQNKPDLNPANYNPKNFDFELDDARFFIIKSYSEDDIHRSIKYSIWCSTNHGNKRLDEAYRQQQAKNGQIFLFFSVNGSGYFCGVAQMTSGVDFNSSSGVWAQSKWQGEFSVRWIYVKDVPNSTLRHITLENNEDKPVTNSRDTQEVPSEKGKLVLKIIHQFPHTTSLFDDFLHYERRQKSQSEQQPVGRLEEKGRRRYNRP